MLRDLLYPRTDGGALAQLVVVVVVWAIAATVLRRRREAVVFVTGLATVAIAWFGFRAVH